MSDKLHWYTNGKTQILSKFCPEGFSAGRLPVSDETKRKHSLNNAWAHMTEEQKALRAKKISNAKRSRAREEVDAETAKAKRTSLERYGVDSPMKRPEIKDKMKQSFIKKYGVDNPAKAKAIQEKIAKTNLQKYGTANAFASETIKAKIAETNRQRYGVTNPNQCKEIRDRGAKKYHYNEINFDSSWELAFYIYQKDLGKNIQREETSFEYWYQGKQHKYFVDFTINDLNYEIKSDYLFRYMTTHKASIEYVKYKCMLQHNVIILQAKDLEECLNYVSKKYGKDFLQNCRNN